MAQTYYVGNGAEPTTASRVAVATGTAIKTLLQVASPSTAEIKVIEWGISFDGSAAATPGVVELITTDVAVSGGTGVTPTKWGNPNGPASLCVSGATATCFSPSGEGTVGAVKTFDTQLLAPTSPYFKQFPLGREAFIPISSFLRIRVKFGTTVNAIAYIIWEE